MSALLPIAIPKADSPQTAMSALLPEADIADAKVRNQHPSSVTGCEGACFVLTTWTAEQAILFYCAFIQLSDPVTLTVTSEKKTRSGLPSPVPL
jgi:hypothetical protein